jgi:hypothetical protein
MMKSFLVIILATAFFGCVEKVIEKPENLIPKDQMAEIYYDLSIITAAKKINRNHLDKYDFETMPYIYKKYGIDSIQFVESDIYYASIPMEYEAIYQTIEERLEDEKSVFDDATESKNDSLRKAANAQRERLRKKNTKADEKDSIP